MANIRELFFNTVINITNEKNPIYYFRQELSPDQNIIVRQIYTRRINRKIYLSRFSESILRIDGDSERRCLINNNMYYFGSRFSFQVMKRSVAQNPSGVPCLNKKSLLAFMTAFSASCIGGHKIQRHGDKKMFTPESNLFHRVNFLSESVDNWILRSIFLWRITEKKHGSRTEETLHIYGIYKYGRNYLSVGLLFGESRAPVRTNDKNQLSLSGKKDEYSIIIRKIGERSGLITRKGMKIILNEIRQNLKYYSPGD